jgi:hypothetical protein
MDTRLFLTVAGGTLVLTAFGWLLVDLRRGAAQASESVAVPSDGASLTRSDRDFEKLELRIAQLERLRKGHGDSTTNTDPIDGAAEPADEQPPEVSDPAHGGLSPLEARDMIFWQDGGYSTWSRKIEDGLKNWPTMDGSIHEVECRASACRVELVAIADAELQAIEDEIMQGQLLHGLQLSYHWSGEGPDKRRVIFVNAPGLPVARARTE